MLVKVKISRTHPKIIGITGSFGKTSTKDAVYEVLKTKWSVYKSKKSLNTEIGLLLAFLQQSSGFSSPSKWLLIMLRAIFNAFFGKKYDFAVLEYGADKPGDIGRLVKSIRPDISIITHISRTHQASGQFKDTDEVFQEKIQLVKCLDKNGVAILNAADAYLKNLKDKLRSKIFWFNSKEGIWAENLKNAMKGFFAEIHFKNKKNLAYFPIMGSYHIDIFLPALLCGKINGIAIEDGIKALKNFKLPPGRMSSINGKNGALLLDSSYNSSPSTLKQALELLKQLHGKRKIAVLGSMNELGDYTEQAHRDIACLFDKSWLDVLVTVGEAAEFIADEALKKGFGKPNIKSFSSSRDVGNWLLPQLLKGDMILLKGSQNKVRLERAVKILMENPCEANRLLCRQESEWENIE